MNKSMNNKMSDKYWNTWFSEQPDRKELSENRVMLSGKCKCCFGAGRVYIRGDYERCNNCNSNFGQLTIIIKNK
jgi:hypothetical protein